MERLKNRWLPCLVITALAAMLGIMAPVRAQNVKLGSGVKIAGGSSGGPSITHYLTASGTGDKLCDTSCTSGTNIGSTETAFTLTAPYAANYLAANKKIALDILYLEHGTANDTHTMCVYIGTSSTLASDVKLGCANSGSYPSTTAANQSKFDLFGTAAAGSSVTVYASLAVISSQYGSQNATGGIVTAVNTTAGSQNFYVSSKFSTTGNGDYLQILAVTETSE